MTLVADALAYGWRERALGEGLSLRVERGRITFLLGPNGAGKTTLVKTLLGLSRPLGGRIEIDGAALGSLSRREVARRIAWVPQANAGYFPHTVMQTVLMGRVAHLHALARPAAADRAIAHGALVQLGIEALADQPTTRLSGGEQQLVRIARALVQQAPLLVLDEPTASLDLGNVQRVLAVMRALADAGHGLLVTTHDPNEALAIGDAVLMMRNGAIVARGAPREAIDEATLAEVYGVRARLVDAGDGRSVCVI